MSVELEAFLAIGLLGSGAVAIVLVLGFLSRKDSGYYEKRQAEHARLQAYVDELVRAGMQIKRATRAGWELAGQVDGTVFDYRICADIRMSGKPSTTLSVATGAAGEFRVHPKGASVAIARFFGMATEFRTGDRALDRAYDISATTDAYAKEIFAIPENLDLLRSLNAAGFHTVEQASSQLSASLLRTEPLAFDALHRAAACLARFQLPATAPANRLSRPVERVVLYAVPLGALLLILVGFSAIDATRPLLADFMIFMIGTSPLPFIAWIAAYVVGRSYLRRHPRISGTVMTWLLVLMPFLAVAQFGVLVHVNERFDPGEPQVHDVPQLRSYVVVSRGDRRRGFRVYVLDSWRGSGVISIETMGVPHYGGASKDGRLWRISVRPGLLGQPWIESAHPLP